MLESLARAIFREKINGKTVSFGGLLRHEPDERDYIYSDLGGFFGPYVPKHEVWRVKTYQVKDQTPNNTCVFHSYATCREGQEGIELSPKSIVGYARRRGLLRGNGFSSLRNAHKAGKEYGIASEAIVPNTNDPWWSYSAMVEDSDAEDHLEASYFTVSTADEMLKALDDGNAVHTGFTWYSSYNVSGGLRSPWILPWRRGWKVGGHAVALVGYNIPKGLWTFRNSFGPQWGDSGDFYVRMRDFPRFGDNGFVSVDIGDPTNLHAFISSYDGDTVKSKDSPSVFRVEGGKLRPYLTPSAFFADGGCFIPPSYTVVSNDFIERAPKGEPIL